MSAAKRGFFGTEKNFFLLLIGAILLIPFLVWPLESMRGPAISVVSFTLIYLIASQALNLQVGYTGLLNLGAVAFVGIGGYTAAILLAIPSGHSKDMTDMVYDAKNHVAITAGNDKTVRVWGIAERRDMVVMKGHTAEVIDVALSPDSSTIASLGKDKKVKLWKRDTGEPIGGFDLKNKALSVCFDADGQNLYVGYQYGQLIHHKRDGSELRRLKGHSMDVTSLRIVGDKLLSTGRDSRVLLWTSGDKASSQSFLRSGKGALSAALSPDGKLLLAGYGDRKARLWDVATRSLKKEFGKHQQAIEDVAFSADGTRILLASRDRSLTLHDLNGAELARLEGHRGAVVAAAFTKDGEVISSSEDKNTRIWTLKDNDAKTTLTLPVSPWALVTFYKNALPKLSGVPAYVLFVIDPHFLAYMTVTPVAMIVAALLGLFIGVPTLRLRGDYFAIVTLGFAQIVQLIVRNEAWLTSGPFGIKNLPTIVSFAQGAESVPFFRLTAHYFLGVLFFAVSLFLMVRVRDSRMGRAFMAIRDDELAAQSNGIHLSSYKIYSFLISSMVAALAGVVLVARVQVISPNDLLFMESVLYLCCIVLGGLGSVRGAVVGGIVIGSMGELMRQLISRLPEGLAVPAQVRYILFGVVLILVMRFKPDGLFPASDEETERGLKEADLHRDTAPSLFSIGGNDGAA